MGPRLVQTDADDSPRFSDATDPCAFDPPALSSPLQNRLLASLHPTEFKRIRAALKPVWLLVGEEMREGASDCGHAVFPVHAVLSMQSTLADADPIELASVGHDGFLGVGMLLGGHRLRWRAVVQSGGLAYRLPRESLLKEIEHNGMLATSLSRYAGNLFNEVVTIATCHRQHSLEQQLCRWFLLGFDRLSGRQMHITQERIAALLGVRREGVTAAASRLQRAGILEYRRGHITLLNRDRLHARACGCYQAIRQQFDVHSF